MAWAGNHRHQRGLAPSTHWGSTSYRNTPTTILDGQLWFWKHHSGAVQHFITLQHSTETLEGSCSCRRQLWEQLYTKKYPVFLGKRLEIEAACNSSAWQNLLFLCSLPATCRVIRCCKKQERAELHKREGLTANLNTLSQAWTFSGRTILYCTAAGTVPPAWLHIWCLITRPLAFSWMYISE